MKKQPQAVKLVTENKAIQKEGMKHISFSQLQTYHNCPRQWDLLRRDIIPTRPSIHMVFGTAMHETIQGWLKVMYEQSGAEADRMPLHEILYDKLKSLYDTEQQKHGQHFSTPEELKEFYQDGIQILDYLKKHRGEYFGLKSVYLVSIEELLYQELTPGVYFKGFVDLMFYDERDGKYLVVDLKTSGKGWTKWDKADDIKLSQLILYKHFISQQYSIPFEKLDIQYMILKRKVDPNAEYPSMSKRVQKVEPASGPIKRKQALALISSFVEDAIDENRQFKQKEYKANITGKACRFCPVKGTQHCKESI